MNARPTLALLLVICLVTALYPSALHAAADPPGAPAVRPDTASSALITQRPDLALIAPNAFSAKPASITPASTANTGDGPDDGDLQQRIAAADATITVNSAAEAVANDGQCTLREAILAANANAPSGDMVGECTSGIGVDVIDLQAAGPYILTSAVDNTDGPNGLPTIVSEIIVNGNAAMIQRDSAAPDFRIFHISPDGNLTLNDLTVSGGRAAGAAFDNDGGGLFNVGTLRLIDTTFSGNAAVGDGGYGGGFFNYFGTVTLINTVLISNTSSGNGSFGGGMATDGGGIVTLINSTIRGNQATSGGGLFNGLDSRVSLINSLFDGNTASPGWGGGLYNDGALELTNSSFSLNRADQDGGGLYNNGGGIDGTDGDFSDNNAFDGGGVYSNGGEVNLTNGIVSGNVADRGGGVFNGAGVMVLTNLVVRDNDAFDGGGAFNNGALSLVNATLTANISDLGGGAYNGSGTLVVSDSQVTDNSASSGGGIYVDGGALEVTRGAIGGNVAGVEGGGIFNANGTVTLTDALLRDNEAFTGGGVFNNSSLLLTTSVISANLAVDDRGGGLFNAGGSAELTGSTVRNNNALNGGGLYNNGGSLILTDRTVISANLATVDGGGGFNASGTLTVSLSTVHANAARSGGGLFAGGGATNVIESTISSNDADDGGGAYGAAGGQLSVVKSTLKDNRAVNTGGGIANIGGALSMVNSTVSGNQASQAGGGLYNAELGAAALTNVTINENTSAQGGGIVNATVQSTLAITNTIVGINTAATNGDCAGPITSGGHNLDSDGSCALSQTGDMTADPMLGPLQNNGGPTETHALLPGSPAIDTGDNEACPDTDQRGVARPADGDGDGSAICDIGAYEVPPPPPVWNDFCVAYRMEITGIGMGDRSQTINPQSITLADPANVNWLLGQVAGRYALSAPPPGPIDIVTDAPQAITLNQAHTDTGEAYTFETFLQPTGQISATVANPGTNYLTPRGLVLYAKRNIAQAWTSVGKTTNEFVWREIGDGTYTELMTFPPLEAVTDLFVTAVVIDNDADTRPIVMEATAGGSAASASETGPTNGAGLNIFNLTVPQVMTGTTQVSVTVRSPVGIGDSLVLVGLNVSYPCVSFSTASLQVEPTPATLSVGETSLLTVSVTPGSAGVNDVEIHGAVDPSYLRLVDVRSAHAFGTVYNPVTFDPATGEFRFGAKSTRHVFTQPFDVLVLEVQALSATGGTPIRFLLDAPATDIRGPAGSVMGHINDGLVIVNPAPMIYRMYLPLVSRQP